MYTIKDLPQQDDLDCKAMAEVRGGFKLFSAYSSRRNRSNHSVPETEWPLPGGQIMICDGTCEVLDNDPEVDP